MSDSTVIKYRHRVVPREDGKITWPAVNLSGDGFMAVSAAVCGTCGYLVFREGIGNPWHHLDEGLDPLSPEELAQGALLRLKKELPLSTARYDPGLVGVLDDLRLVVLDLAGRAGEPEFRVDS